MAAQKQGSTIDISRPIRDVANAIAKRSAAKERARQFNQRMDLQKAKLSHQQARDNANAQLAKDKFKHKVQVDRDNNKLKQSAQSIAQGRLDEAKKNRQTRNNIAAWKVKNQVKQHADKMEHAKNVLAEKAEHDKVSEAIKARNANTFEQDMINKTNRNNAAVETMKQHAQINKEASGVDYNANAFKQSSTPKSASFTDTINTLRPNGSSLGGKVGAKDSAHGPGKSMEDSLSKGASEL